MKNQRYAVWIDKRKAMILKSNAEGVNTYLEIESHASRPERFEGEKTNKTGLFRTTLSNEKRKQERQNNHITEYVMKVADEIKEVNAVLIMGSGETRHELENLLLKRKDNQNAWIENKPYKKLNKRGLELEMEKHFNLHLG
ncbi:MAG: hypothetical protein KAZ11_02115 [Chitinophagaceae bacterium]|jgi:hypothetical protein|nr:hypothetical protein [Chitinophagaceae bacterium]